MYVYELDSTKQAKVLEDFVEEYPNLLEAPAMVETTSKIWIIIQVPPESPELYWIVMVIVKVIVDHGMCWGGMNQTKCNFTVE